ncbi:MAG: polyribonucleotide nucleotidyltransferase [Bacteroidales bacterium OttesenSCG-928-I14]|jgi:polyribonucleotide nucleotidyltransferase|nr:polyribonucleotide nucleotidyltransferase [Bacteroidales bacterium OttesenSCG-928-I14]
MIRNIVKTINLDDGRIINIETGKLAKQADGSVILRMNNTMILATVCAAKEANHGLDFMPLHVEYKEKFSAFGRFPSGFTKREGRASDHEILTCRLIDRTLRPLFPSDYHTEVFINIILFSSDGKDIPDALAGLAASAALSVSTIPFNGPVSEVRVIRTTDGKFKINPTFRELEKSDMDIMVGATKDSIIMVEGEMAEISEKEILEAIKFAHKSIQIQCNAQIELAKIIGESITNRTYCHETNEEELRIDMNKKLHEKVYTVVKSVQDKNERAESFRDIIEEYKNFYDKEELSEEKNNLIEYYYNTIKKEIIRQYILDEGIRLDGRKITEIRPIWSEVSPIPGPHGSAIFSRGETQALATVTLGTKFNEKIIDDALINDKERFLLHYNFPPFATGEARPQKGVGRREIGHGNLAHRALKAVIPSDYPYVIRIVSDILESNGSSSMATVCAGTLSLMDAGVKIKSPVSGIAMGLISSSDRSRYAILSDILGDEDHLGDMDFKIAGTKKGITAIQMDIKVNWLSYEIFEKALIQAKEGRKYILDEMLKTIAIPRTELKQHTPRIEVMIIPKEFIGAIIGPGGKIIQKLQEDTETTISIEEIGKNGHIEIFGNNKNAIDAAVIRIKKIIAIPKTGEIYKGEIRSIMPYGAFIEFLPGKEGLLHISDISWKRLESMKESGFNEGDTIEVKLVSIDSKSGKFKLSRKILLPFSEKNTAN